MITISITGHTNIEKACGLKFPENAPYGTYYNSDAFRKVYKEIEICILTFLRNNQLTLNDLTIASGMARGVDEVFAIFAINYNLPLILSVPNSIKWHKNRGLSRNVKAQAVYYDDILRYENIVSINEIKKQYNGKEYKFANFARNQNLVDVADYVLSYKRYDSSGTDDCIKRAETANKYLFNVPEIIEEW